MLSISVRKHRHLIVSNPPRPSPPASRACIARTEHSIIERVFTPAFATTPAHQRADNTARRCRCTRWDQPHVLQASAQPSIIQCKSESENESEWVHNQQWRVYYVCDASGTRRMAFCGGIMATAMATAKDGRRGRRRASRALSHGHGGGGGGVLRPNGSLRRTPGRCPARRPEGKGAKTKTGTKGQKARVSCYNAKTRHRTGCTARACVGGWWWETHRIRRGGPTR